MTSEPRIFPVDTNFQKMARRPGGISRDRAVERAEIEIAEAKVEFDEWLSRELTELTTAFEAARDNHHDPERLAELASRGRQLRDVTATIRFELLSFVGASLCDFLDSVSAEAEFPIELDRLSFGRVEPVCAAGLSGIAAGPSSGPYKGPALARQACEHPSAGGSVLPEAPQLSPVVKAPA